MQPENTGANTPNPAISNTPPVQETAQPSQPSPEVTQPNTPNEGVSNQSTPDPTADIAKRLGETTVVVTEEDRNKPQAHTPMLIDLANMSPEQLQMLKSMLNVTPDRVTQKKGNIRVEIRSVVKDDVERYIVDFKPARLALDYHAETGQEFESHKIPVRLDGETEYFDMHYTEFMQSDRVPVEVVAQRSVEDIIKEGQVLQRETGKIVEKEVTVVTYFYTVKLPNGKEVEIQGKVANA